MTLHSSRELQTVRVPRSYFLLILIFAVGMLTLGASAAGAAPVAYYSLPGTTAEPLAHLTASGDGLWMVQKIRTGPANEERTMRVLRTNLAGIVTASTPEIQGDPVFTDVAPAGDGGLWISSDSLDLRHVSPGGTVTPIELPTNEGRIFRISRMIGGKDGRAWAEGCTPIFSEPGNNAEECHAIAVDVEGNIDTIPLPELAPWPENATSRWTSHFASAADTGVWFSVAYQTVGDGWSTTTLFITYDGNVTEVALPGQAVLVGPAGPDSAWWLQSPPFAAATIGTTTLSGATANVSQMANISQFDEPEFFHAELGRNNKLVWSQNASWSDKYDGQIGVAAPGGGNVGFLIPLGATAFRTNPEQEWWSGACTFGSKLYEGPDGGLWTISAGHPARLTLQALNGEFSVFWLGEPVDKASDQEIGLGGMVETDPHSLWFTLHTASGPKLARLDPLDPPPAESRERLKPKANTGRSERQRILTFLRTLIRRTQNKLSAHRRLLLTDRIKQRADRREPPAGERRKGRRAVVVVQGRFPVAGRVRLTVKSGKGKKSTALARAEHSSEPGKTRIRVRITNRGMKALRSPRASQVRIVAQFNRSKALIRQARRWKIGAFDPARSTHRSPYLHALPLAHANRRLERSFLPPR